MKDYKGEKFTKKQLEFVVEKILIAVTDRVESILPTCLSWDEYNQFGDPAKRCWISSSLETAGMALAVLYAQLTGEGLGIGDALTLANKFDEKVENWVAEAWKDKGKKVHQKCHKSGRTIDEMYTNWPNTKKAAKQFVEKSFQDFGYFDDDFVKENPA